MTNQTIFDKVATHLLTQNDKAMMEGKCKYRGEEGMTCAVGCLIPDYLYKHGMEGYMVGGITLAPALRTLKLTKNIPLLEALQYVHDSKPVTTWKENLRKVAQAFHLNRKVLTQFP